jgi:TonB family protein
MWIHPEGTQKFQIERCNRVEPGCVFPRVFSQRRGVDRASMTWQALLIFCCVACILPGQTPDPSNEEPVYDLGPGVTPPRVVKQVNPHYATNHGVRAVGSVIIALVVSSKGIPRDPRVVKGLDKDLDESAVKAVKEWLFAPAQKDGKAIAVRVSVQIEFHEM